MNSFEWAEVNGVGISDAFYWIVKGSFFTFVCIFL